MDNKTVVEEMPALLDVNAVAKLLDVSARHVWRLHDKGAMPLAVKLGALRKWSRITIQQWLTDGCPSRKEARRAAR